MITSFKTWFWVKPRELAASFWPLLIPCIPALTHSAIKVAVYKDNANVNAINSGGSDIPPSYMKDVADNCFNSGISKFKETPPIKKDNPGRINKINRDI